MNCRGSRRSCSLSSMWQYQRPEEEEEEDSAQPSPQSSMDTSTSVSKQTQNLYHRRQQLDCNHSSSAEGKELLDKLYSRVYSLLFVVVVNGRHTKMTQHIIEGSIQSLDNFSAEDASRAFLKLETFARNLIHHPWKAGFKRIKIYSGFLKLHIEKYLKGTKVVFEALGYQKEKNELVLKKNISQKHKESVALDCYIAYVEMQIFKELFNKVSHLGYSYMDVYRSRQHCVGDLSKCEQWILNHCKPKPRVPVETEYIGAEAQVMYPRNNSSKQDESLDIYSASVERNKHVSYVGDGRSEHTELLMERPKNASEGTDKLLYATGTFDDHMKESMRILTEDKASPRVAPPSYETSSLYPSDKRSDDEWGDVREKIKKMGSSYADPGGRGDILGTLKNSHGLESKQPTHVKTPNTNSVLFQGPSIPRPPIAGGSGCMPKQRIKSFGRTEVAVDGDQESPNRSPTGGPKVSSENLIANIQSSSIAYTTGRDRTPDFSTFRTTDIDSQNPQYVTKLAVPTAKAKFVNGQNETDGGDNDVYVSLRETNTSTADLKHGRPSFQENFQETTARFYQHDSAMRSLPALDGGRRKKVVESNILKTTPSLYLWECEKCTFANKSGDNQCEMCGTSRKKGAEQRPLKSGGAQCQMCTLVNEPGSGMCSACGGTLKGSSTYV